MEPHEIPTLETERLWLRPFRPSDFDAYAELTADPEVARYLLRGVFSREQAWRVLAFLMGHWQLRGCGMWAVESKATAEFLGTLGFADPAGWPGFELAWTLARRFWGNGSRLRLHPPGEESRHQSHPPGQPGFNPGGRAARRAVGGEHRDPLGRAFALWDWAGERRMHGLRPAGCSRQSRLTLECRLENGQGRIRGVRSRCLPAPSVTGAEEERISTTGVGGVLPSTTIRWRISCGRWMPRPVRLENAWTPAARAGTQR
jgi:hypothetical protein